MGRQMPLVVSHYTVGTGYEQEVQNLIYSLDKLGLDYDIEPMESLGSWRANSNYCSRIVQEMMRRYPERDILRVDADAVFQQNPDLFLQDDFDADVAAHVAVFSFRVRQGLGPELLGGTLFFRNIPAVRALVNDWADLCMVHRPRDRNGDILQEMLNSGAYDVVFRELPATYCKIFDIMRDVKGSVIEHFQASRRFKRQVDRRGVIHG